MKRLANEYPQAGLTRRVIGAAMEVHRELGSGFLERVYHAALEHELSAAGVPFVSQAPIPVVYKDRAVGGYYADLLVDSTVLCEIKAVESVLPVHEAQLIHYLKATRKPVGLLLNFGSNSLQVKRRVYTR